MQVKISEILHHAADHCLSLRFNDQVNPHAGIHVICCMQTEQAVYHALVKLRSPPHERAWVIIREGMNNLGFDYIGEPCWELAGDQLERMQCEKYQWLKFCALLAEEQGA